MIYDKLDKLKYLFVVLACSLFLFSCGKEAPQEEVENESEKLEKKLAKFEPADGEVILFVGQEQDAVGGLENYNDGYFDHFETPGGWTMYTKIRPGDESFGFQIEGLCGMFSTDYWGDGPSNMSEQVTDPDFKNCALAIGLELVNHEAEVAAGEHDSLIVQMGEWFKSMPSRPIFLRTGYEFHGSWNHYNREDFIEAYKRIKDKLDEMEVDNVAYVWQSHGFDEPDSLLEAWYPGDEYVDWCGFSFFNQWQRMNMLSFAKKKGKPVFIAEASPTILDEKSDVGGQSIETVLSNPEQAKQAWTEWFTPFFKMINDNPESIKAISYINAHWRSRPMWKENPTFQYVDARLETSEFISGKWNKEIGKEKYLKSSPNLFDKLWNNN